MLKKYFILLLVLIIPFLSYSQEGFPVNGVNDIRENNYAFITGREINLNGKQQILYDRFNRKYSN